MISIFVEEKIKPFWVPFVFILIVAWPAVSCAILFNGVRPLGMGNAFTAVANDENAVFYNPAGLSKLEGVQVGVINPQVEVADDSIDFAKDADDVDFDDTGEVADLLRKYTGEPQHVEVALFPHFGTDIDKGGILFGVLGKATVDVEANNPVWPQANVKATADYGPVLGGGFELPAVKGLRLGMAVKYLGRESLDEIYTPAEIASDDFEDIIEDDQESGNGVSADIGLIYDIPLFSFMDASVGVSALNIPEMGMGDAADIKSEYNVGFAVGKKFEYCNIIGAVDVQDITENTIEETGLSRRIHLGAEIQFPYFALRTGINDGYFSAGATFDAKVVRIDVASYTAEKGAFAGQEDERRYVAQFTLGW